MAKMFSKSAIMHQEILVRKADISETVMTCIRDRDLTPLQKKDALRLIPYLAMDQEAIDMFIRVRIEDYLVEFLQSSRTND